MSGLDIEGMLARCPTCGHDWSGHAADPDLADWLVCEGKRGLGYMSGCRCRLTLAGVLREQIAAWLVAEADWRWEPDSEIPAVLAELAALVAPSRVPGEET